MNFKKWSGNSIFSVSVEELKGTYWESTWSNKRIYELISLLVFDNKFEDEN